MIYGCYLTGKGKGKTNYYYTQMDGGKPDTASRRGTVIATDPSPSDTASMNRGCLGPVVLVEIEELRD